MSKKYLFGLNEEGRALIGTVVDYPDEYTVEGTEEVWLNQERSFYAGGEWVIYDKLELSVPNTADTNESIVATAQLPVGSPDSIVYFQVMYTDDNGERSTEPESVAAVDGVATQGFNFADSGLYTILVSSAHHGSAAVEVSIIEPA